MINLRTVLIGLLGCMMTACASTPGEPADGSSMLIGPDGGVVVVDKDGNPSTDPAMLMLGQMMSDGMKDTAQSLNEDEILFSDSDGNYTHIQSGGICPVEWSTFKRVTEPTIFNPNGMDVGCSFQSEALASVFTFYFYKTDTSIADEKVELKNMLEMRVPTAKAVDDVFLLKGPTGQFYEHVMLESKKSNGIVARDGVFLANKSGWRLKLRVTYPASRALEVEQLAGMMMRGQLDQINALGGVPVDRPQPGDAEKIES